MKTNVGLWIDHREAILVTLTEAAEETRHIQSNTERHLRRSGDPDTGSFEIQKVPADDSQERAFTGHLAHYYDEIISQLGNTESIFIFGPGEAKGELKKRLEKHSNSNTRTIEMQTTDKMTEPQIVALVRHHFHQDPIRQ